MNEHEELSEMTPLQKTIFLIFAGIFFGMALALIVSTTGCDVADASVYKAKYEAQVQVNDSLKTYFEGKVTEISTIAHRKIDSLRVIEGQLRVDLLACQNTVACDTGAIIRSYGNELTQYLFNPLNDRLNQVIDSLNRR